MPYAYRDLIVWQRAVDFVIAVYDATKRFPRDEVYGLTAQVRRAAVSIPSNIAEGQGRLTEGEFRHFLGQARGSLLELETQIEIARRLKYVPDAECVLLFRQTSELGKILNGLIGSDLSRGGARRAADN
jgi:four helix bundle protein